jgi:hypothetical protein
MTTWRNGVGWALMKVIMRAFLTLPLGAVVLLLCVSVVGLPLGLPLAGLLGAWVSRPLRKHPQLNIKGDAE